MIDKENIPEQRFRTVRQEGLIEKLNLMSGDIDRLYRYIYDLVDSMNEELSKRDQEILKLNKIIQNKKQ